MKNDIFMSRAAAALLAKSDLGATGFAVYFMILSKLDFGNLVLTSQAEIARELGIQRQSVHQVYKKLLAAGILLKSRKHGVDLHHLNPNLGWKGSALDHHIALGKYRKEQAANITGVVTNPTPDPNTEPK